MTNVLFLPEVVDQFLELAEILYSKQYLGFKEVAIEYANQLFMDIKVNLPIKTKKKAPVHFERYGQGMYGTCFTVFMKLMVRLCILLDIWVIIIFLVINFQTRLFK